MKITQDNWEELYQCELYQKLTPRYQKVINWAFQKYIDLKNEDDIIQTKISFVSSYEDGSIKIHGPVNGEVNRRQLLCLDALDFDLGLQLQSDAFMPFFGKDEVALFNCSRFVEVEEGDICLVQHKDKKYFATFEETGIFKLDGAFLGTWDEVEILGFLRNIETK